MKVDLKTEWFDLISLLAMMGKPEDVVCLCNGVKNLLDGKETPQLTSNAESAYRLIENDYNELQTKKAKKVAAGKARWSSNAQAVVEQCSSNAQAEKEIDEKEKNQKKEKTEKEYTDASVANTYSNIASVLAPSLSCPELVETNSEPALITLPLNDGSEWPVTTEMVTEWSSLYPAVDVMQELRNMRGWLLSKPKNRKTPRGIRAFVTTWLSKEQDRGPKPTARSGTPQRRLTASEIAALPFVDPFAEIRGTQ